MTSWFAWKENKNQYKSEYIWRMAEFNCFQMKVKKINAYKNYSTYGFWIWYL